MLFFDEVRAYLHAHKDDPIAADLLKKLENYYGFDLINPTTTIGQEYDKILKRVQEVYNTKYTVKKQNKLIEAHQIIKRFCTALGQQKDLDENLLKEYRAKAEMLNINMFSDVLGVNITAL